MANRVSTKLSIYKTHCCMSRSHLVEKFRLFPHQTKAKQKYLLDFDAANRIASKLNVANSLVYECNPGAGVLTRALLNHGAMKVVGLEHNRKFLPFLEELEVESNDRFMVEYADIGKLDVAGPGIPPAISSHKLLEGVKKVPWTSKQPVAKLIGIEKEKTAPANLMNLLLHMLRRSGLFSHGRIEIALLFTEDRAQKLLAQPGDFLYNRLAILAGMLCDVRLLHVESNVLFDPLPATGYSNTPPKIHLISLLPKQNFQLQIHPHCILMIPKFLKLLTMKTSQPLARAMESISPGSSVLLGNLGLSKKIKPMDLTPTQYKLLFETFFNWDDSMLDFLME
ncbi:dimethyladenosine transferase 2, mitochondrial-like [Dendronephthya gigantea]|uniref:dimethyladenosine transferase 2, mitochondrial-like n=1 Tax=Dendronephthya gigantea TaxID=151771 RepID=UPI00106D4567|nr:dimethyladenosine transferase 2, mitochondrial-like [Dendronephthya gigantea]